MKLPVDPLPDHVTCAKRDGRKAKQCGTKLLGRDVHEVKKDAVLLAKAFEIGFAQETEKSKRLLTQSSSWSIHAAPRQGPPAPRSQGVISASVVVAPGQIFYAKFVQKPCI